MSSVRKAATRASAHFRYLRRCQRVDGYCCTRRPCAYDRHVGRVIRERRRLGTIRSGLSRPW